MLFKFAAEFNTITYKTNSSIFKIESDTGRFYLEAGMGDELDYDAGKKEFYVEVSIADNCKDACSSELHIFKNVYFSFHFLFLLLFLFLTSKEVIEGVNFC